ncbi:helicase protein, partial [Ostertagia ostertagi]
MKKKRRRPASAHDRELPLEKKAQEHEDITLHLPIHDVQFQIMEALHKHETVVLIGETGCGKSTQVPQFCARIGLAKKGRIGITQPRRLAAVSLANRVAKEVNSPLGQKVGYHVRFEKELSEDTEIVFLTDGILLREAIHDPLLNDYTTILVDEAHERSLHTDILLNVLRLCQRQRKETGMLPLRIVIMSATLEAKLFSKYFDDAPVFHAELNPDNSDYVYNSLVCIKDLHQEEPLSDHFLVFLTGREEIECAVKKLKELNEHFTSPIYPVPLFAAMSSVAQMKAFEPPPEGHRKVVLATNIAETSLTIPGIRVVIDSGKVKTRTFTAADRIDVLRVHDISKAQAIQRAGRAGREAPGKCYRLYPFNHFEKLKATSIPEILRSNLAAVLLEMLALGLRRPRKLKLIQQPDEESMIAAERELLALGAATIDGKYMTLTPV